MKTEQAKFAILGEANEPALDPNAFYLIDYNKLKTVDDIKSLFEAIGFNFVGNHPRIALVAHLLDRNNPIYPPKEFEVEEDLSKLDDIENEIAE